MTANRNYLMQYLNSVQQPMGPRIEATLEYYFSAYPPPLRPDLGDLVQTLSREGRAEVCVGGQIIEITVER